MKKNTLSPDLDLLCKTLCRKVLNEGDYQNLSNQDLNQVSSFLIQFNNELSSSRESLHKSLQNWFLGKNTPSASKVEEIAKSLGYLGFQDFIQKNKLKIQTTRIRQSASLSPFHKTLMFCGIAFLIALFFPLISGITIEKSVSVQIEGSELLISIIQAVVVISFYMITRFTDFGGRDKIKNPSVNRPVEVQHSMQQFFKGWKYLWLSFSLLYVWFCILYGSGLYTNPYAQSASDIVTIFSSLCFAYLFSVMDVESIPRPKSKKSIDTFYTYLSVFTIGLSISSILSILDRYYNLGALDGMGTYILGYTNVIVMLYFFGRLESHYLNVNRFVLLPLYTYAIIQIAYVLFFATDKGGQSFEASIIGMALLLKAFLYFLIREWIKEGKIETYFFRQHEREG